MELDTTLNIKILLNAFFRYRCYLPNELIILIFYKFQALKHPVVHLLHLDLQPIFKCCKKDSYNFIYNKEKETLDNINHLVYKNYKNIFILDDIDNRYDITIASLENIKDENITFIDYDSDKFRQIIHYIEKPTLPFGKLFYEIETIRSDVIQSELTLALFNLGIKERKKLLSLKPHKNKYDCYYFCKEFDQDYDYHNGFCNIFDIYYKYEYPKTPRLKNYIVHCDYFSYTTYYQLLDGELKKRNHNIYCDLCNKGL